MDGNFGIRPEIYAALRQDLLARAARERRAREALAHSTPWPRLTAASFRQRAVQAAALWTAWRERAPLASGGLVSVPPGMVCPRCGAR